MAVRGDCADGKIHELMIKLRSSGRPCNLARNSNMGGSEAWTFAGSAWEKRSWLLSSVSCLQGTAHCT